MNKRHRGASTTAATEFRQLAQRYCRLVGGHDGIPIRRLLSEVHRLLPALYAAGLALPMVTPAREGRARTFTNEEWWRLFRGLRRRLGNRDAYCDVFDVYDREDREAVIGSLADDFADVYRELIDGLRYWRSGDRQNAVWEWSFGLQYHWGEHATGAMRALQALCHEYHYGQPAAMPDIAAQRSASRVTAPAQRKNRALSRTRP